MLTHPREQKILDLLKRNPSLRVTQISHELGVSEATVRRDLNRLQDAGQVQRMHGLVLLPQSTSLEPKSYPRTSERQIEKERIGRAAAELIRDGETVFIGSGSTALEVARFLIGRQNLTIITNSLPVVNLLALQSQLNLVVIGGVMRQSELSFIGHIAEHALKEVRVDKVVLGIPALDVHVGLTNDYLPEVVTDRAIINLGRTIILVVDHSKFGRIASAYLAPLNRVHILVTDELSDPELLDQIRESGIQIIIAS